MKNKILFVDDDVDNTTFISQKLTKEGYDLLAVNDSRLCEEKIESFSPDLILLDVLMPNLSGLDLLKIIRKKYNENTLPIIMVTIQDTPDDIALALDNGANDYITKPVNMKVAISRINTQINQIIQSKENVKNRAIEAINAMVVTYNHEINNPLSIAFGSLIQLKREISKKSVPLGRLEKSLERIKDIVKKIEKVSNDEKFELENYSEKTKMVKIGSDD